MSIATAFQQLNYPIDVTHLMCSMVFVLFCEPTKFTKIELNKSIGLSKKELDLCFVLNHLSQQRLFYQGWS